MNNKTTVSKNKLRKKVKKLRRKVGRVNRKLRRRRRKNQRVRRMGVARFKNFRKFIRVVRTDSTSMVVSGLDLVYSIPDSQIQQGNKVLTMIPSNPAYWKGTRISALALGYQQFRPLRFIVHYVPCVSVVQQGNIIGGTLWDNATVSESDLQQALITSSGGMSTQVYKNSSSNVRCKDNLSRNLYNIGGELNNESNPFMYVAIGVGNFKDDVRVLPGYFWVSYTYSFKNPIGNTTVYKNSGLVGLNSIDYHINTTAYLCQTKTFVVDQVTKTLNMFSRIQIDSNGLGGLVGTYNGDFVPLENNEKVWVFQNYPVDEKKRQEPLQYILTVDSKMRQNPNTEEWLVEQGKNSFYQRTGAPRVFLYQQFLGQVNMPVNSLDFAGVFNNSSLPILDELQIERVSSTINQQIIANESVSAGNTAIAFPMNNGNQQIYLRYPGDNVVYGVKGKIELSKLNLEKFKLLNFSKEELNKLLNKQVDNKIGNIKRAHSVISEDDENQLDEYEEFEDYDQEYLEEEEEKVPKYINQNKDIKDFKNNDNHIDNSNNNKVKIKIDKINELK